VLQLNHWFCSFYCRGDILHFTPPIHTPCDPIEPQNYLPNIISFISNPMLTYSYSPVLHYSICKWVNWVMQCFTNPCPMPKCNLYYFWVIVIALFDTYVIQFTWVIPNSNHGLVKHKDSSLISWTVLLSLNILTLLSKLTNLYLASQASCNISLITES
jgi:hypothetical protein